MTLELIIKIYNLIISLLQIHPGFAQFKIEIETIISRFNDNKKSWKTFQPQDLYSKNFSLKF